MTRRSSRGNAPIGLVIAIAVMVVVMGALTALHRAAGPVATTAGTRAASAPTSSPPPTARPAAAGTALALLATLAVKGKAPLTGYDRVKDFGSAWLDADRNGCDTRDDVLHRDLRSVLGGPCIVKSGVLIDPYTGRTIRFVRGVRTSTAVQIDHVVPLAEAWRTGAQRLSTLQRERLANDPINLFAVDGPTNESKGDSDAASWLPPRKSFRCTYIAHQVAVKAAYTLWVTPAERDAMARILRACPTVRVPVSPFTH
jgi:hypothetical protein